MVCYCCFVFGLEQVSKKKASLFARQRRRLCKWQCHLEAKKFEIRKSFCKLEVQNQLWWASLQSGSDPQWTIYGKIPALKLYDSETGQKWCHEGLLKVLLPWDHHGLKVCIQGEETCLVDMWMHPQWCLQWDPRSGCRSLPVLQVCMFHHCIWITRVHIELGLRNKSRAVVELAAACDSCVKNGIIPNFRNSLPCLLDFQTSTEFCKFINLMQP